MTLRQFITENRNELQRHIGDRLNHVPRTASCDCPRSGTDHYHNDAPRLTASELADWIRNDESLYNWARRSGCKV